MSRWTWVAALCALVAAPIGAQDEPQQTVEGAQRFLSVVASNQQPHFMAHYYIWPTAGLEYRIDGASGEGCATQFTGQPFGFSRRSYNGFWVAAGAAGWNPATFETVRANNGLQRLPLTVDWSRVNSVSLVALVASTDDGSRHNVLIRWPGGFITLNFADNALAKRVEYAANFLKAACDKTAETGF
jgi:hypothetical protein